MRYLRLSLVIVFMCCSVVSADEATQTPMPDLELRPFDGQEAVHISDYKGKPVLLTFWASWCRPCRQELPELAGLSAELKERGFTLLTVNVDQSKGAAEAFLTRYGIEVSVYNADPYAMKDLGIAAIPTSILIDPQGMIDERYEGYFPSVVEDIRSKVYAMFGENAPAPGNWIEDL